MLTMADAGVEKLNVVGPVNATHSINSMRYFIQRYSHSYLSHFYFGLEIVSL